MYQFLYMMKYTFFQMSKLIHFCCLLILCNMLSGLEIFTNWVGAGGTKIISTNPQTCAVKSLKFVENGGITPDGDTRSKVDVSFTDSLDKDFYKVLVLTRYGKDQPFRSTYTSVNEPGSVESARNSGVLFGDQSFDGQDKTMSFQFCRITEQQAKGNIQLRWRNVSESYFKYSKTANVHFESRDNPFATPSDIFSNIEGGLGYFFLHNQRTYNVP